MNWVPMKDIRMAELSASRMTPRRAVRARQSDISFPFKFATDLLMVGAPAGALVEDVTLVTRGPLLVEAVTHSEDAAPAGEADLASVEIVVDALGRAVLTGLTPQLTRVSSVRSVCETMK